MPTILFNIKGGITTIAIWSRLHAIPLGTILIFIGLIISCPAASGPINENYTAALLPYGVQTNDFITAPEAITIYYLPATAGDALFVRTASTEDLTGGPAFNPHIILYAPDGITILAQDVQQGNGPAEIQYIVNETGDFYLTVESSDPSWSGAYGIAAQKTNAPENTTTLIPEVPTGGTIDVPGGVVTYTITSAFQDTITISLVTGTYEGELILFDPDGRECARNISLSSAVPAKITMTTAMEGDYSVIAGGANGATGAYAVAYTAETIYVPFADFTATPTSGLLPLTVQFYDTSGDDTTDWSWNFGDGTPDATVQHPEHTYNSSGVFDVTLTVTHPTGTDVITKPGYITVTGPEDPLVQVTISARDIANGDPVVIEGSAEEGPASVAVWIIGPDFFTCTTEVVNQDGTFSAVISGQITIEMPPGEYYCVVQHPMANDMFDVYLASEGSWIGIYDTLDNGTIITEDGTIDAYAAFTALTGMLDSPSLDDTYAASSFVLGPPYILVDEVTGVPMGKQLIITGQSNLAAGNALAVTIANSSEVTVASGETAIQPSGAWSYEMGTAGFDPGEYLLWVGCSVYETGYSTSFFILEPTELTANFTADVTKGIAPLNVTFTDESSRAPDEWTWDFGDGIAITSMEASTHVHTYEEPGWYSVSLTVTEGGEVAGVTRENYLAVYLTGTEIGFAVPGISTGEGAGGQTLSINQATVTGTITVNGTTVTISNPGSGIAAMVITFGEDFRQGDGIITGTVTNVMVTTTPILMPFSGADASAEVRFTMGTYPESGSLGLFLAPGAPKVLERDAAALLTDDRLVLDQFGFTLDVIKTSMPNVTSAGISITVPDTWSTAKGGCIFTIIRRDDGGTTTVLETNATGGEGFTTYSALAPGFSSFAIAALSPASDVLDDDDGDGFDFIPDEEDQNPDEDDQEDDSGGDDEEGPGLEAQPDMAAPPGPAAMVDIGEQGSSDNDYIENKPSFRDLATAVQDGGASTLGLINKNATPPPAASVLSPPALPVATVAASVALVGFGLINVGASAGTAGAATGGTSASTLTAHLAQYLDRALGLSTQVFGEFGVDLGSEKISGQKGVAAVFAYTPKEWIVLIVGSLLLGIAFLYSERAIFVPLTIFTYFLASGIAIAAHELAHVFLARKYLVTESRVSFNYFGILSSFFTAWIFGNVFSQPLMTRINEPSDDSGKSLGIVLFVGPVASVCLALVFLLLIPVGGFWTMLGTVGFAINLLEAAYSLIPLYPLDGKEVYHWNKGVWAAVFFPLIALYLALYII